MRMLAHVASLTLVALTLAACRTDAQRKDDERVEKEIAANAADAAAQETAKLETIFRTACKVKAPKPVYPIYDKDLKDRCRDQVREALKVPGSGSFPSVREESDSLLSDDGGCNRIYASYVDATNPLGVKVRTQFTCTYDGRTGLSSVKTK